MTLTQFFKHVQLYNIFALSCIEVVMLSTHTDMHAQWASHVCICIVISHANYPACPNSLRIITCARLLYGVYSKFEKYSMFNLYSSLQYPRGQLEELWFQILQH